MKTVCPRRSHKETQSRKPFPNVYLVLGRIVRTFDPCYIASQVSGLSSTIPGIVWYSVCMCVRLYTGVNSTELFMHPCVSFTLVPSLFPSPTTRNHARPFSSSSSYLFCLLFLHNQQHYHHSALYRNMNLELWSHSISFHILFSRGIRYIYLHLFNVDVSDALTTTTTTSSSDAIVDACRRYELLSCQWTCNLRKCSSVHLHF